MADTEDAQDKTKEFNKALSKAKIHLMAKPSVVFFSSLVFSLRHVRDESIPTACTDGRACYYNPDFFLGLNVQERVFLMLHETLHCAYMHLIRAKALNMNPRKANIAGDHVINLQLIDRGFEMPECGLADPQYADMSYEQVYAKLPKDPPPPPMEDLMHPGKGDQGSDGDDAEGGLDRAYTAAEVAAIEREMEDILVRASIKSKMAGDGAGTIPGDIEIFLNKLLHPKLPLGTILRRYLQTYTRADYSWRRPNRRFFPKHYLPSLHSPASIDITVAIDTSGSVSEDDMVRFTSEIAGVFRAIKPKRINLVEFDTKIQAIHPLSSVQAMSKISMKGRGGTDIRPLLDHIDKARPTVILVFTDGYFSMPRGYETRTDVIWLIHGNPAWDAPFGRVIHYEV